MKISLFFILLSLTMHADACTCFSFPERINSAIVNDNKVELFTGKIISRKKISFTTNHPFFVYTVKIDQRFTLKSTERKIKIISSTQPSACGYLFTVGKKYLITTGNVNQATGMRQTSICRRNVLFKEAQVELELIQSIIKDY